jgi:hypothetical protein
MHSSRTESGKRATQNAQHHEKRSTSMHSSQTEIGTSATQTCSNTKCLAAAAEAADAKKKGKFKSAMQQRLGLECGAGLGTQVTLQ